MMNNCPYCERKQLEIERLNVDVYKYKTEAQLAALYNKSIYDTLVPEEFQKRFSETIESRLRDVQRIIDARLRAFEQMVIILEERQLTILKHFEELLDLSGQSTECLKSVKELIRGSEDSNP